MSAPATNGNGKPLLETLGNAVPVLMLIAAIGGMALTPLYIMATNNSEAVRDLKAKLEAHTTLDSHPVMKERVQAAVERLDQRITTNDKETSDAAHNVAILQTQLAALQAKFESDKATLQSNGTELETQFRALDNTTNVNLANQLRVNAMLWHESFGWEFPAQVYFPTISKERR